MNIERMREATFWTLQSSRDKYIIALDHFSIPIWEAKSHVNCLIHLSCATETTQYKVWASVTVRLLRSTVPMLDMYTSFSS